MVEEWLGDGVCASGSLGASLRPLPGQAGDPRLSPEAEIRALKEESKILKEELAEIEDRLKELEAGESEDD